MLKQIIRGRLERQVRRFIARHQPLLVVVTGSVGKTSTKMAIATVLAEKYRVRVHEGNYNADMSVPLALLGVEYPSNIRAPWQWYRALRDMRRAERAPKSVDVIVQELGTDHPGEIAHFGTYLTADIAVVTAVSDEHMEFFGTLDAVAQEELSVAQSARLTLVNTDDIDAKYLAQVDEKSMTSYGLHAPAEYRLTIKHAKDPLDARKATLRLPDTTSTLDVTLQLIGDHSLKAAAAAAAVGLRLGLTPTEVRTGLANIHPTKGRMNLLRGADDTILIDDTYNSSPLAVKCALETLAAIPSPQHIAILGSMNELGETSTEAHRQAGEWCDPKEIDLVVTIGADAEQYLAPAARAQGCTVESFASPYDAGEYVRRVMKPGAVIAAKGSQNRVFAEEAVKQLLADPADSERLVRQSPEWLAVKRSQFGRDN